MKLLIHASRGVSDIEHEIIRAKAFLWLIFLEDKVQVVQKDAAE